jgi:amino acid transporter
MAVTAADSQIAKTGTGVVGSALTTAGSVVLTIPVVGWIVGGIMVAVGGALSLASSRYNPERAAAREQVLRAGGSWTFANAVARAAGWPEAKLAKEIDQAQRAYDRNPSAANADQLAGLRFARSRSGYAATIESGIALQQVTLDAAVARADTTRKVVVGGSVLLALLFVLFASRRSR